MSERTGNAAGGFLKTYSTRYKNVLRYKNTLDEGHIQGATAGVVEVLLGLIDLKGQEPSWLKTTRPLWDLQGH